MAGLVVHSSYLVLSYPSVRSVRCHGFHKGALLQRPNQEPTFSTHVLTILRSRFPLFYIYTVIPIKSSKLKPLTLPFPFSTFTFPIPYIYHFSALPKSSLSLSLSVYVSISQRSGKNQRNSELRMAGNLRLIFLR